MKTCVRKIRLKALACSDRVQALMAFLSKFHKMVSSSSLESDFLIMKPLFSNLFTIKRDGVKGVVLDVLHLFEATKS